MGTNVSQKRPVSIFWVEEYGDRRVIQNVDTHLPHLCGITSQERKKKEKKRKEKKIDIILLFIFSIITVR
jgi:hypothetical protein